MSSPRRRQPRAEAPTEAHAAVEDTGDAPPYRGAVVIEWPPAAGSSPYAVVNGWGVSITDAATGKQITTCSGITVRADVHALVTADLTLLADAAGEPLLEGEPVPDGDGFATGTFPFLVAEMRVRER